VDGEAWLGTAGRGGGCSPGRPGWLGPQPWPVIPGQLLHRQMGRSCAGCWKVKSGTGADQHRVNDGNSDERSYRGLLSVVTMQSAHGDQPRADCSESRGTASRVPRDGCGATRGRVSASRYGEKCNDQVIVCEDRMPTPEGVGSSSVMGRPAWADATEPRLANLEAGLCLSHGRGGRRLARVATAPNSAAKIATRRAAAEDRPAGTPAFVVEVVRQGARPATGGTSTGRTQSGSVWSAAAVTYIFHQPRPHISISLLPSTDFAVDHVFHCADGRCRGAVVIMTA
jgi:hypothetical protein